MPATAFATRKNVDCASSSRERLPTRNCKSAPCRLTPAGGVPVDGVPGHAGRPRSGGSSIRAQGEPERARAGLIFQGPCNGKRGKPPSATIKGKPLKRPPLLQRCRCRLGLRQRQVSDHTRNWPGTGPKRGLSSWPRPSGPGLPPAAGVARHNSACCNSRRRTRGRWSRLFEWMHAPFGRCQCRCPHG